MGQTGPLRFRVAGFGPNLAQVHRGGVKAFQPRVDPPQRAAIADLALHPGHTVYIIGDAENGYILVLDLVGTRSGKVRGRAGAGGQPVNGVAIDVGLRGCGGKDSGKRLQYRAAYGAVGVGAVRGLVMAVGALPVGGALRAAVGAELIRLTVPLGAPGALPELALPLGNRRQRPKEKQNKRQGRVSFEQHTGFTPFSQ